MKHFTLPGRSILVIFTMSLLAFSCSNEGDDGSDFDIQGHRGCRGLYPENTIKGFKKAIAYGVTTLEMDVVISKDRKVVLSHEPFLSHEICYDSLGADIPDSMERGFNIYQMDYEEIVKCDCGSKPHPRFPDQVNITSPKPLLEDVIREVEAFLKAENLPPVKYNIETKTTPEGDDVFHPRPADFVELLMEVVKESGIQSRVIIQSFDTRTLTYVLAKYPTMPIALLIEEDPDFEKNLEAFGSVPDIYSPNYFLVNKELIAFAKENDMKVIPWTSNDRTSMGELLELGVDGIITDFPDKLVEVLRIRDKNN